MNKRSQATPRDKPRSAIREKTLWLEREGKTQPMIGNLFSDEVFFTW
jgi:hypothetical protein